MKDREVLLNIGVNKFTFKKTSDRKGIAVCRYIYSYADNNEKLGILNVIPIDEYNKVLDYMNSLVKEDE